MESRIGGWQPTSDLWPSVMSRRAPFEQAARHQCSPAQDSAVVERGVADSPGSPVLPSQVFAMYDKDKDGWLSAPELGRLVADMLRAQVGEGGEEE
jgi:hypothetical protein